MSTPGSPETPTDNADFPSQYDPKSFEDPLYKKWEEAGAFHSEPSADKNVKPYTIMIPPPNVTGVLHLGHALNNTLQDILIRYQRMNGKEALWMPGTDHAGIATQNVVEKQIAKSEKKNRYQIGRAELIKRIWKWKEQSGGTILQQLRKLGASCDWERTRFTMDEGLSKAVRHAFVRLHKDGQIYRGKYLVNWCPRCRTTLSDDEVEHEDIKGKMYELHYPLVNAMGGAGNLAANPSPPAPLPGGERGEQPAHPASYLTVATTRPETMLGDTAVAVHPDDERYKQYVGQFVELPLTGRRIPVIADSALELGFGTGCLKVTPAHDPVDYQIGLRHQLPLINIFTEGGMLNENTPEPYRGMDRFKARAKIFEDLKALGLTGDVKDHPQQVGHCYRCHTIVEPYLSAQWFIKMKELSELAVKATAEGRVRFHPDRWSKVYLKWFDAVRDWPISRQVWWGHQIPVWYDLEANANHILTIEAGADEPFDIEKDGKKFRYLIGEGATPIVSIDDPSTLPEYKNKTLIRDPDVLDTWFSSGLWPFSTLGWPDKTPELDYYYPTNTLVTSRGIIYFWVARMVMLGEKFMGREPFSDVVIHGTVLDGDGEVMSKSKGNGIDPLDIIGRYGADAMRFTLADMSTGGQDLKFPVQIACPFCDETQDLPRKRSVPTMQCRKCKQEFQQPVPNEPELPEPKMGPLDSKRFEKGRNFANKVWNATRFVLTSIDNGKDTGRLEACGTTDTGRLEACGTLRDEDRWILSRLNTTIGEVSAAMDNFEFSKSVGALYDFFWNEFCSWYIELTKARLQPNLGVDILQMGGADIPVCSNVQTGMSAPPDAVSAPPDAVSAPPDAVSASPDADRAAAEAVLLYTLDRSLRLLHPFCPFVSEALWAELDKRTGGDRARRNLGRGEYKQDSGRHKDGALLITASWPKPETELIDLDRESQFASIFESVIALRTVRQELIDNSPKERKKDVAAALAGTLKVVIRTGDATLAARLNAQAHILTRMANIEPPLISADATPPKPASATAIKGATIYVALAADLVDVERLRLGKEISKLEQYIPKIEGKLKNDNFVKNAPPELVEEERQRLREAGDKLANLRNALSEL